MITEDKIRKITNYKTWTIKRKVDALLEIDAIQYTELGIDSTKTEKLIVKKISRKIYKAISLISPLDGHILKSHMDEFDLTKKLNA